MTTQQKPFTFHNLLVTGGCGFIGSNFIRYLFSRKEFRGRVLNLDLVTYAGNPFNLVDISDRYPQRYVFHKGDIADRALVTKLFQDYDIDGVCHFAAETHVDRSIDKPANFITTNIIGTFQLLEAVVGKKNFQRFPPVSTDEVYGSLGPQGLFTEESPYCPNSPYSASKASSDHLVRAYHATYNLPVTISNCSNNYGPYQFPEKLIPLMILNSAESKTLPVYGDGKHIRDWLYVTDHCAAIWKILQSGEDGETYNVGGDSELENIEIVRMICDLLDDILGVGPLGPRHKLITLVKDRPGHDRRYAIDFSKIKKDLGWIPRENLETGLLKTIQWYISNRKWIDQVRTGEYRNWIDRHYGTKL